MTRVLLGWQADESEIALAREELPECEVETLPRHRTLSRFDADAELLADRAAEVDCLLGWTINPSVYERALRLRLLAWLHSGFDPIDLSALAARGISLTNVAGANGTAVAEQAMALLLALAKRVVERDQRVKHGGWTPLWEERTGSRLLADSTLAMIGLGAIGLRVARRARAFEMRVVGVRRSGQPTPDVEVTYGPDGLHQALAQADFVVIGVPHTPETHHLIGAAELAAMKPRSYLINVARGRLVEEMAVREALDSGHLAGFASDVWWSYTNTMPEQWHYGVPSRLGVHLMDQVTASHDSACDIASVNRSMFRQGVLNVKAFVEGRQPPNLVFDGAKLVGSLEGLSQR